MRFKWLTVFSVTATITGAYASVAAAAQSHQVVAAFTKADAPFAVADSKWSRVLGGSSITLAHLQEANAAFVPAIEAFNAALAKIHFTGTAATDIAKVITLQKQEITILKHTMSIKSFETSFGALTGKFVAAQAALSKDLGLPAAEIVI